MKKKIILILFLLSVGKAQYYQIGDNIENFGAPICMNGVENWSYDEYGANQVVFLSIFATWWGGCQAEAPQLEAVYQQYINENVIVLTAGKSWGAPYTCEEWSSNYGLTFPILDDEMDSLSFIFGNSIPHNVVINGNGQVIYTSPGHNLNAIINAIEEGLSSIIPDTDGDEILDDRDNCVDIYNPGQSDFDADNIGDDCDLCDNLNVFTNANIYGEVYEQNNYDINIFDVLTLLDIIENNDINSCGYEIGDITGDGEVNIFDAISIIQMIIS